MIRFATIMILAITSLGLAEAKESARQVRKAAPASRPAAGASAPSGNINAPSTDFSKVERSDAEDAGRDRGGMRPVMGAGGIGLGGGF